MRIKPDSNDADVPRVASNQLTVKIGSLLHPYHKRDLDCVNHTSKDVVASDLYGRIIQRLIRDL